MRTYKAVFTSNQIRKKFSSLKYKPELNSKINKENIKGKILLPSSDTGFLTIELNIAYQVISRFPDAKDIEITENEELEITEKQNQNEDETGALIVLVLVFLAFILAILLAPIIITLGMYNKFILKSVYKDVVDNRRFKSFRKPYAFIGFALLFCFIVPILLGIVLSNKTVLNIGLYGLSGTNIVYFIVGLLVKNHILKKYPDDYEKETKFESIAKSYKENKDSKENLKPFKITAIIICTIGLITSGIILLCFSNIAINHDEELVDEEYSKIQNLFLTQGEINASKRSYTFKQTNYDYHDISNSELLLQLTYMKGSDDFYLYESFTYNDNKFEIYDTFKWGQLNTSRLYAKYYFNTFLIEENIYDIWPEVPLSYHLFPYINEDPFEKYDIENDSNSYTINFYDLYNEIYVFCLNISVNNDIYTYFDGGVNF